MAPLVSTPPVQRADFRRALLGALDAVREVLHARGRLSDRHAALDLVSTLLLATTLDHLRGPGRLTRDGILNEAMAGHGHPALVLRDAVAETLRAHLAAPVGAVDTDGFALALDARDDPLALRFLEVLGELTPFLHGWRDREGGPPAEVYDLLNDVFGQVLTDSFSDERQLGQYLTPKEVVSGAVDLIQADLELDEREALRSLDAARAFGRILDPACGVGSFLTGTLHALFADVQQNADPAHLSPWLEHATSELVVGVDKSPRMLRLALASLTLFGAPRAHLLGQDALRAGTSLDDLDGEVGLILTNPPFGAEFEAADVASYRIAQRPKGARGPKRLNSELLFLERSLRWLRPGGRLIAVVPDSVLSNRGVYRRLREQLSGSANVRAVLSLPPVTFGAAGTTTKTSLLYLRKHPGPSAGSFMTTCASLGYDVVTRSSIRVKVPTGDDDLARAVATFAATRSDPRGDLPAGRWVEGVDSAPRWDAGYHSSLSPALQALVDGPAGDPYRVARVAERITDRVDPALLGAEAFDYIDISCLDGRTLTAYPRRVLTAEAPGRARKPVRAGDVLVSTLRPQLRAVAVVPAGQGEAICSTALVVLRPKGIEPLVLARLLQTDVVVDQLIRLTGGVAYPAFDEVALDGVVLPIEPGSDALAQTGAALKEALTRLADLQSRLDAEIEAAGRAFSTHLRVPAARVR